MTQLSISPSILLTPPALHHHSATSLSYIDTTLITCRNPRCSTAACRTCLNRGYHRQAYYDHQNPSHDYAAYVVHHHSLVTSGATTPYSLAMAREESLLTEAPVVEVSLSFVSKLPVSHKRSMWPMASSITPEAKHMRTALHNYIIRLHIIS
jgi:hypothetical protein